MRSTGGPLTALVTGGSSGIGEAIALHLAGMGHRSILVSENGDELERAGRRILEETGVRCELLRIDLSERDAAQRVVRECESRRLDVDILVNCAGLFSNVDDEMGVDCGRVDPGDGAPDPGDSRVGTLLALHVHVLTRLSLLFGRRMIARGGGYILNVSSISALFPDPSSLTYGPSKRYVLSFSRLLHLHWREHGVGVTCIVPGAVDTAFFRNNDITLPTMVRSHLMPVERCAVLAVGALFRGRCVVLPGFWSRLHVVLFRILLRPALYTRLKRVYLAMRRKGS